MWQTACDLKKTSMKQDRGRIGKNLQNREGRKEQEFRLRGQFNGELKHHRLRRATASEIGGTRGNDERCANKKNSCASTAQSSSL